MEKEYYIVVNDSRVGPLTFAQLSEYCIEPSTLVWTAGMPDWARAGSLPELDPILTRNSLNEESAFGAYARPEQPQPAKPWEQNQSQNAYGNPQYRRQPRNEYDNNPHGQLNVKTNWKTLSIVALVVGFIFSCIGGIVGIFALLEANKAENFANAGNYDLAENKWSSCKTLTIVSFVLTGIGLVANVVYVVKMVPMFSALYGF